jgi:hypothetical protein
MASSAGIIVLIGQFFDNASHSILPAHVALENVA